MYIVKSLHERQYNAAEIAEQLWLSERTIEKDIEQLEEGINVLEQSLKIRREIVVKNKTLNSIHPLFLSANLSQIVVLLQGLEYMAREKAYSEYAVRLASNIWNELSEYGRSRIMKVTDLLGLNINWFKVLEQNRNIGLYSSEIDCSNVEGAGNVLDFLKNGKSCTIELENESGSVILEKCQITKFNDPWLIILHNCEEIKVNIDSVVSAYEYSYQIY
jgi:biotin operon repressor